MSSSVRGGCSLSEEAAREDDDNNNNNNNSKYDEETKINAAFSYLFFSASRAALTTLSFFF